MSVMIMGSRYGMLPRWYSSLGDKKLIAETLEDVVPDAPANKRGQPPKHPIKSYLILMIPKEFRKASLRDAWEQKLPAEIIEKAIREAGKKIEELLGYEFSAIDATSFTTWHNKNNGFHLLNRIHEETVYPVSMTNDTVNPMPNTRDTGIPGHGDLVGP